MPHPIGNIFLDYVQGDFGQVHLGDNAQCKIVGMGKVQIKQKNGNTERGETYTRYEKKSNFNRKIGK